MRQFDRREFMASATAMGATSLWARRSHAVSRVAWRERRELFPQGVASGDPDEHSVILWTRYPPGSRGRAQLAAEISLDPDFREVIATMKVRVLPEADCTCRVLVGSLLPATVYWYRFTDDQGNGSRIGRSVTAPRDTDPRTVRFAFVSSQSVNEGAQPRRAWQAAHQIS